MARARSPDSIKAEKMYQQGMKLIDIAKELNVPDGTVRRWKSTQKWDCSENERSELKSERSETKKKVIAEEVKEVLGNTELTDKQRLFCIYYIRCFNATKAYQKAYGCDYVSAMQNGSRLLRNDKVKREILKLKQERLNRELLSETDIFQKYMDIAFSDITDYLSFGQKEINYIDKSGEEQMINVNYVDLNDSHSVDGTLISELSQGKDGVKVKLNDRMKALQWLADHMDLATEEQKIKVELLKAQKEQLNGEGKENSLVDDWIEGMKEMDSDEERTKS